MARKKQAQPGHNSAAAGELLSFVERIERLESDKAEIAHDIKEVKAEAKSCGFDVKAIEKIVKERGETDEQRRRRRETEDITDVYRAALGMLDGTPLGDSARERLSKRPEKRTRARGGCAGRRTRKHPARHPDGGGYRRREGSRAAGLPGRQTRHRQPLHGGRSAPRRVG